MHRPGESSAAYHLGLALQARRVTLGDLAAGLRLLEPMCPAECARRADRAQVVVPALAANIEASAGLTKDGIAFTRAGRAAEAERVARAHLAATQALVLERFDDGIVTVSSTQGRQAIQSGRPGRI